MSSIAFNFIVGKANSGTTLLMSMLNAHPSLQATPEVDFFVFFYHSWKNKTNFSENDHSSIKSYLKKFENRRKSNAFSWDEAVFRNLIEKSEVISFEIIYQCFYRAFVYAHGKKEYTHCFDKNPYNTMVLEDIIKAFPSAKFVYVIRDPRANYLSRKEKLKNKKANIYFDTQLWKIFNTTALNVIKNNEHKFCVLKYEDLAANPAGQLKRVSEFFDFPYNERMLSFYSDIKENNIKKIEENTSLIREQAKEKYLKLSRPVNTDRVDAWRERLTKDEVDIISNICSVDAQFEYDIKFSKTTLNFIKYYKGLLLANKNILKNKLIYYLPLSVKLKLIKVI